MFLLLIGFASLMLIGVMIWLAIVFHPARAWDFQPVAEDVSPPPAPSAWPPVAILVPARNEADSLPLTLPALLQQDYPGSFRVILVDDRSSDGTADVARKLAADRSLAHKLSVLQGEALPEGWVGKVWALEQAARHAAASKTPPKYLLLTDADILHAPHSLRRLVAESAAGGLALNSRMALLRCASGAERLLIPAFVFFFNLLYPMRWVNHPAHPVAAAAGGCVLLDHNGLQQSGGLAAIRGEIIDDVNLARRIKAPGRPIRLALSRDDVRSLRAYETLDSIWKMVRRTAFTELNHSWLKLGACVFLLFVMFLLPPLAIAAGAMFAIQAGTGLLDPGALGLCVGITAKGIVACVLMADVYRPAVRFFGLPGSYSWSLPVAGVLYGLMTLDSAWKHLSGRQRGWR
ncbi:MAG: glycosyltransferase [Planctomycetes bacterium]|nr:glycosyltransferase [Planctomycetota bacterium]